MKILINATALDSRGSYSLIKSFIDNLKHNINFLKENEIKLIILVAKPELCINKMENITIIYVPFPKKSIFHKYLYEKVLLPNYIRKRKVNNYLSLQNIGLTNINIPQYVLIHQSLLLEDWSTKELEFKNYIKYKILMQYTLKKQLSKIESIFVQTNWMKESFKEKYNYKNNIRIIRPETQDIKNSINPLPEWLEEEFMNEHIKIFYPTSSEKYKNNLILINSVKKYNLLNHKKIILYITLVGESEEFIRYIGKVNHDSIYNVYKRNDCLIFPSLTESLGLPIQEAKQAGIDLILPELPYTLDHRDHNTILFDPRREESIINALENYVLNKYNKNKTKKNTRLHKQTKDVDGENYIDYIKYIFKKDYDV